VCAQAGCSFVAIEVGVGRRNFARRMLSDKLYANLMEFVCLSLRSRRIHLA